MKIIIGIVIGVALERSKKCVDLLQHLDIEPFNPCAYILCLLLISFKKYFVVSLIYSLVKFSSNYLTLLDAICIWNHVFQIFLLYFRCMNVLLA